jgi:hypothetical protein
MGERGHHIVPPYWGFRGHIPQEKKNGLFLVCFWPIFWFFSTHCNVILIKESNSGQWIRILDVMRSYILYFNGEFNTMRVIGVALNIYWFSWLRVSRVNFLVLCLIVICFFLIYKEFVCALI